MSKASLKSRLTAYPTLTVIVAVLILVAIFFGVKSYIEAPRDLGPKLEYIGKSDSGCNSFMKLMLPCDSDASSTYYFATDMSERELKNYFRKAKYIEYPSIGGGTGINYNFTNLSFRPNNNSNEFAFSYYDNSNAVINDFHLRQTSKSHVISIGNFDYLSAKSAL